MEFTPDSQLWFLTDEERDIISSALERVAQLRGPGPITSLGCLISPHDSNNESITVESDENKEAIRYILMRIKLNVAAIGFNFTDHDFQIVKECFGPKGVQSQAIRLSKFKTPTILSVLLRKGYITPPSPEEVTAPGKRARMSDN